MSLDLLQFGMQLGSTLLVGAVSAWVAGSFAIRHGLARAQRKKAFDHRLEWYEKAFRTITEYRTTVWEFVIGFHFSDPDKRARLLAAVERSTKEIDCCLTEAVVFGERAVLKELASLDSLLANVKVFVKDFQPADLKADAELIRSLLTLTKRLESVSVKIAQSVRRQLSLDEITEKDLVSKVADAEQRTSKLSQKASRE